MDCRTAALLLDLARPGSADFDPVEAQALESHLQGCSHCSLRAEALRHEQAVLSRAMRAIPVPAEATRHLLQQLTMERRAWYRRLPLRHPRWAAAASLLFLLLFTGTLYSLLRPLPFLDGENLVNAANAQVAASPTEVERYFAAQGMRVILPRELNYNFLVSYAPEGFEGRTVPCLRFQGQQQRAYIYILSSRQFDLEATLAQPRAGSGIYTIEFRQDPTQAGVFYMLKFTGDTLDWLMKADAGVGA